MSKTLTLETKNIRTSVTTVYLLGTANQEATIYHSIDIEPNVQNIRVRIG